MVTASGEVKPRNYINIGANAIFATPKLAKPGYLIAVKASGGEEKKEAAGQGVGDVKILFEDWKKRREDGSCGEIKKPKAPEKEEKKNVHGGALVRSCHWRRFHDARAGGSS